MIPEKQGRYLGKKHDWTERRNQGGGLTYELLVWDGGRKIDRFIWNTSAKCREILELLRLKFGLNYK